MLTIAAFTFPLHVHAAAPSPRAGPVIDMHVHAMQRTLPVPARICSGKEPLWYPAVDPRIAVTESNSVACAHPIASATNPNEHRERTLGELRAHNVRRAVVMARLPELDRWQAEARDVVVLPAIWPANITKAAFEALRSAAERRQVALFGEIGAQYAGRRADDPLLEPFWAIAEALDVPVGIHLGEGMPGFDATDSTDRYRASLTSPFQLEEVLHRHPRLRIYVMHAASPLTDEMIAMLFEYPQLYVDVAANDWNMPRAQFYDQLKRLVDAGFSQRIMFGSDQTIFPQAIGLAIETIDEAPFLTAAQKRDILYNNAARFLRLTKEQIAEDHAPVRAPVR